MFSVPVAFDCHVARTAGHANVFVVSMGYGCMRWTLKVNFDLFIFFAHKVSCPAPFHVSNLFHLGFWKFVSLIRRCCLKSVYFFSVYIRCELIRV